MEQRGRFALLAALLDFVPALAEKFDVRANFVVGGAACGGSNDETAWIAVACFADQAAKARAILGGDDFARDAGVMNRWHVDQEAAGERDVAGDARALFAERFLGDLNDDVLTGFQHFADKLRTAWRTGMAMTTIVARATWAAGTAFESRTGRTATAIMASTIGTASTAVWTTTAAAVSITSATLWALETGAGISAADACGIAREIFARSGGATDARGASFAGKKNDVIFNDGGCCGDFS